jgi:hypothetical protein
MRRWRIPFVVLLAFLLVPASSQARPFRRSAAHAKGPCKVVEIRCEDTTQCADIDCGRRVDTCLAQRQARTGEEGQWILRHYTFDRFLSLNRVSIGESAPRSRLKPALLKKIESIEAAAGAHLEGYLLDVKRMKRDRKACGKGALRSLEIWIGATPGAAKSSAIRAQLTSKLLKEHPGWSLSRLKQWRSQGEGDAPRIRIRGYLLYNNLKAGEVAAGLRPTAWEVSPVTEVLFCPSGWKCGQSDEDGWLELDTL